MKLSSYWTVSRARFVNIFSPFCHHFMSPMPYFQTREMFPNGQTSQNQSLRPDLMSSLSPLGVSLLSPQAPSMLPTLLENSVQSFTNETQHLMAVRLVFRISIINITVESGRYYSRVENNHGHFRNQSFDSSWPPCIFIFSMAAYHEIEKRENQRLFSSVPNQTTDVMDIDIESTKLVKSTN